MDPVTPIANISLEQYAEIRARIAASGDDPEKTDAILAELKVVRADWDTAHQGFRERLSDMANHGAVAARFVPLYQAALTRVLGLVLQVSFEDYVALSAEALWQGLSAMLKRRGLPAARFSQIVFYWNSAMAKDPSQLALHSAMVEQEWQRLEEGGAPRDVKFGPQAAPDAAGAPANTAARDFDKKAEVAAQAVGTAFMAGVSALGSALDSFGKSVSKPKVGSHVKVAWSDGNYYPGTVVQAAQGKYLVAMGDGQQHWVPENYVKTV